jgi:uncharacterized repeat protein (TIGR01451 family)
MPRPKADYPTLTFLAMLLVAATAGCANWSFPRIDPSGERIFLPPNCPPPVPMMPGAPLPGYAIAPTPGFSVPPNQGAAPVTPTASNLALRVSGPAQASVGSTITYRIELTNTGGAIARDALITGQPPGNLSFVNSNPAAAPEGNQWRLGDVGARQTRLIEVNYRVQQAGTWEFCATAAAGGLTARGCARTSAAAIADPQPGPSSQPEGEAIQLEAQGPQTAAVGEAVKTTFRVINRGSALVSGLVLKDRFDEGLEHASGSNPIQAEIGDLGPGAEWRRTVTLRVTKAGRLCQDAEVASPDGTRATATHCLVASGDAPAESPAANTPAPNSPATQPPTEPSRPALTVRKTGPQRLAVGELAQFVMTVTNTGTETLTDLKIVDSYDKPTLEVEQASTGFTVTAGSLEWTIRSLAPGRSVERQVNCRCKQPVARACNRVVVSAEPNLSAASEACLEIVAASTPAPATPPRAAAAGALTVGVVGEKATLNPGDEAVYQVSVTNSSAQPDRNVTLNVTLNDLGTIRKVESVVRASLSGRTAKFEPIAELRAGETVKFDVHVRAADRGTLEVRAQATSQRNAAPESAVEKTQVGTSD